MSVVAHRLADSLCRRWPRRAGLGSPWFASPEPPAGSSRLHLISPRCAAFEGGDGLLRSGEPRRGPLSRSAAIGGWGAEWADDPAVGEADDGEVRHPDRAPVVQVDDRLPPEVGQVEREDEAM